MTDARPIALGGKRAARRPCGRCGGPIWWARTNGRSVPVDGFGGPHDCETEATETWDRKEATMEANGTNGTTVRDMKAALAEAGHATAAGKPVRFLTEPQARAAYEALQAGADIDAAASGATAGTDDPAARLAEAVRALAAGVTALAAWVAEQTAARA